MTRRQAIVLFTTAPFAALAQTNEALSLDELFGLGQQFIEENVDADALAQLGEVDEQQVRALLKQLQDGFDQDYILDLAALKDAAQVGLKLLESNPDTLPYADWLRPRLDYFDVAEELDQSAPAPPREGEKLAPRKPTPSTKAESRAWAKSVKARPRPAAASLFELSLKPIFTQNGVPKELFWLAEVESGFNAKARSPAGAVGLYQLMPATAKSLGLSTWPFDERKSPDKCADAAARYLRTLCRKFKDWPLTIAAYNAGEGRVRSKLDGVKSKSFEAIASKLPSETQMYVPKLNAILQLREGTTLEKLAKVT
jgi:membrane-bound lytic murein transglycosylase D